MNAIEVSELSKRYRLYREKRSVVRSFMGRSHPTRRWEDVWALRDVSFAVTKGETIGVIGRNGSGKTTLLKLLANITVPDSGRIDLRHPSSALLELGAGFESELTGRENIYLSGTLLGLSHRQIRQRFDRIVEFAGLGAFIDAPIQTYSTGMWMRLGFAMAIHVDFEILLIDEVLAVGDLAFQDRCFERFRELKAAGTTILFVSHSLQQVNQVCNRAIWLDAGRVRMYDRVEMVTMGYAGAVQAEQAVEAAAAGGQAPVWQRRWGTQEAVIVGVSCLDGAGREATTFRTGEPMEVVIHYQTRQPVEAPVFGVGVHRADGTHLCGPNTRAYGFEIEMIEGSGEVRFAMPALPLLEGQYRLSVAVYDRQIQHPLDHHDQMYGFDVLSNAAEERYGLIKPFGTWQHRTRTMLGEQIPSRI